MSPSLPPSNSLLPVFLPESDSCLCTSLLPLDAGWTPSSNGNLWVWQTWLVKLCSLVHLAHRAEVWEQWCEVCRGRHNSWQLLRALQRNICLLQAFILKLVHTSEVAQKSYSGSSFFLSSFIPSFLSISVSSPLLPPPPFPPSPPSLTFYELI